MAPPPPPYLAEELVEDILLRFPSTEPASLFRAALVCKHWYHLISAPGFRRRFRERHRTPPMLGFLYRGFADHGVVNGFVPTAAAFCSPRAESRSCRALDARHGRILLQWPGEHSGTDDIALGVWDPITGVKRKLPHLPRNSSRWNAAVLCSAAAGDCDHLDCHRGPFLVVVVGTNDIGGTFICTCSSDVAASWSEPIFSEQQTRDCVDPSMRSALTGNALYFGFLSNKALRYDLELCEISFVQLPPRHSNLGLRVFTTTEDGGLGLATAHGNKIYVWLRNNDGREEDVGWRQDSVIELETLLHSYAILTLPYVVGFAEGISAIFVKASNVLFTIDVKTCKVEKVYKGRGIRAVVPYMSFYTPGLSIQLCSVFGLKMFC
ncbi:unnamed protein product [Urochloa decumbens]|uniref:F-box domain-containing protein n=1 Tax=Urochloa decumbens TaxID=240449 RepID=A0ABC9GDG0_9POAL